MPFEKTCILITGANTGLGFGVCRRLIDEFLESKPPSATLTLIFTTRSAKKGSDTLKGLEAHLSSHANSTGRIQLRPENVELTNIRSVLLLARKLVEDGEIQKIDAIILNAGIAGVTKINFPLAMWQITLENAAGVTWPRFKVSAVGTITAPQSGSKPIQEPPIGEVFCANVFGHYLLAHWLMPLLRACNPKSPGRVIWTSSIESAYEHSKRLTDLLALTAANQEATRTSVISFLSSSQKPAGSFDTTPEIHVVHPGVVTTAIVPLAQPVMYAWAATAYAVRWLGSPWHTNTTYVGAMSASWVALASSEEIRERSGNRAVKWGSAVDRGGNAKVVKTDVPGWGLDGTGKPFKDEWWGKGWGRIAGAKDATKEDVEGYVEVGARVWREMERLRIEWEGRIGNI